MVLSHLSISLQTYGVNEGKYTGTINFKDKYGAVEIVLSPDMSQKMLAICADALVDNAKKVAEIMSSNIIEQSSEPLLENRA